jgi:hypothetical protein
VSFHGRDLDSGLDVTLGQEGEVTFAARSQQP